MNLNWKSISAAVSAASLAHSMYKQVSEWYKDKLFYTVRISEDTYVYDELMLWLNSQVHTRREKFVSQSDGITRHYDSAGTNKIVIDGHHLEVWQEKPAIGSRGKGVDALLDSIGGNEDPFSKILCFASRTKDGIDALERKLEFLTEKRRNRPAKPQIYTLATYGWDSINPTPRKMESVFLPGTQKEDLMADVEQFFTMEERFAAMGLPWHRGYLLYGPPGNGKSSLCKALAHQYSLSMYHLQLSSVKDDKQLSQIFSQMQPRSVILLEDVDVFRASSRRAEGEEKANTGLTLAGLLNSLDGVGTPHGLISIMTTNHKESLDPALVRPGRVDKEVYLGPPERKQITDMFAYIYGEPVNGPVRAFGSMADVTEIFKRHPYDAEAARTELKE